MIARGSWASCRHSQAALWEQACAQDRAGDPHPMAEALGSRGAACPRGSPKVRAANLAGHGKRRDVRRGVGGTDPA